jgi:hypothetical protein
VYFVRAGVSLLSGNSLHPLYKLLVKDTFYIFEKKKTGEYTKV